MDESGSINVVLVSSKSKLAPLSSSAAVGRKSGERVTIPQLELMVASLLAKHVTAVALVLNIKDLSLYLWTDSAIVRCWVRSDPIRYKEFVRNRIQAIQMTAPGATWHHVPGSTNPVDLVSRGASVGKFVRDELWFCGPRWLLESEESWPRDVRSTEDADEERKVVAASAVVSSRGIWELIDHFSSLRKLLAVTSWCRRSFRVYFQRKTGEKKDGVTYGLVLAAAEMEESRLFWVRQAQSVYFNDEIRSLVASSPLPANSKLQRLTPFVDGEGTLRLRGRIQNSRQLEEAKHPAILPKVSKFTELVLRNVHLATLHGSTQLMLQTLRRSYWIVGGSLPVRSFVFKCAPCTRQRAAIARQRMGQLPTRRVELALLFVHSGVDYAGPFHLLDWRHKGAKAYKGFLIVFVCLVTSTVHLELATDYITDGFLAAFKRFTARKGMCKSITSDCGMNLVGADRQLQKLFEIQSTESQTITHYLDKDKVTWIFNPPGAPHFGGKWEAAVKSVKFHLRRVIVEAKLTYEEFSTILAQVEVVLNSRPLCPLHEDSEDLEALTPGHFLAGRTLNAVPDPSVKDINVSRLSHYQQIRQMMEKLWARWSVEYLEQLQLVIKWQRREKDIAIGTMVLIINENVSPTKWALGRVLQLHLGQDGLCRVATVKTQAGVYVRPIVKLCQLPVEPAAEEFVNAVLGVKE